MKKRMDLDHKAEFFQAQRMDDIVVLRHTGHLLLAQGRLDAKKELLDYLDLVSKSDAIRVIVEHLDPEQNQMKGAEEFYLPVLRSKADEGVVLRMYRYYDQYVLKVLGSDKVFVHAHQGPVPFQILNMWLSGDYTVAAHDTVFYNSALPLGLAPKGAYFLNRILGHDKTFSVLLSDQGITADEALTLGLVDKVVSSSQVFDASLEAARRIARHPATSLSLIKKFLNYDLKELTGHFEMETRELMIMLRKLRGRPQRRAT